MASLQAAATSYATPRPPDDPVLHLLLDVRLPADRRPDLGARRRARPRLPDGRDRRPDDARPARASSTTTATRHLLASTVPNCRAYDPAFAYELAAIVRDGIERMYAKGEDVFYYVTLYNENYAQPPKPEGVDEGIIRGLYRLREAPDLGPKAHRARLVGSGSILQQVVAAQELLAEKFGIAAEVYSAPSFPLLRRDALEAERWNRLHPDREPRVPYVASVLGPGRRADRRRDRLAEGAARHGLALAAAVLRLARDRRLRAERHARGAAGALRDRRRRTSRRRRSPSWPAARRCRVRRRRPGSRSWASTRRSSTRPCSRFLAHRPRSRRPEAQAPAGDAVVGIIGVRVRTANGQTGT